MSKIAKGFVGTGQILYSRPMTGSGLELFDMATVSYSSVTRKERAESKPLRTNAAQEIRQNNFDGGQRSKMSLVN
jgi:hypothetical protein